MFLSSPKAMCLRRDVDRLRVRKRSVYAQQPRFRANALHLTLRVRLLAMSAAFDFRKCKRLLLSSLAVIRRVRLQSSVRFY